MPHGSSRRRRWTATTAALCLAASLGAQAPQFARTDRLVPTPLPRIVAIGDFNGDGMDDFNGPTRCDSVGGGRYEAVGPGVSFALAPVAGEFSSRYVAVADFNGDGADDVVQATNAGFVYASFSGGPAPANAFPAVNSGLIAAGDPDGDGDQDLAVQHGPWPNLLLNDGNGVFTAQVGWFGMAILNNSVNWMRFADLDGDGFDDLVGTTNGALPTTCFAQRSFGNGAFDVPFALVPSTPSGSGAIGKPAIGDVDGDGRSDLLLAYGVGGFGGGSFMAVRRLLPTTTYFAFDAPVSWPIELGALSTAPRALVDLDQDGAAEIVVGTPYGTEVRKFVAGAVGAPTAVLPVYPDALVPMRADSDGRTDLAAIWWAAAITGSPASEENDVTILFNDGVGGLAASSGVGDLRKVGNSVQTKGTPLVVDLDGDADADLLGYAFLNAGPGGAAQGAPLVGRNDGHGTIRWEPPAPCPGCPTDGEVGAATAADADADGDLDLFLRRGTGSYSYLRNDGAAGFVHALNATYGVSTSAAAAADFDGDGDDDVAVTALGSIQLHLGGPSGWTAPPIQIAVSPYVYAMIAGDFDADGDPDLLVSTFSPARVLRNDGGGAFTEQFLSFSGNFNYAPRLSAGDFDGDGDLDFFSGNVQARQSTPTSFALQPALAGSLSNTRMIVADFDGDGDLDAMDQWGPLYLNDGAGNFSASPTTLAYEWAGSFDAADIDGDGDVDVVGPGGGVLCNLRRQLKSLRTPRPGLPYDLRISGEPFAAWAAFVAFETSFGPVAAPPYGRLAIDPSLAYPLDAGALDAFGRTTLTQTLDAASTTALAGVPLLVQAVVTEGSGYRLTNSRRVAVGGF